MKATEGYPIRSVLVSPRSSHSIHLQVLYPVLAFIVFIASSAVPFSACAVNTPPQESSNKDKRQADKVQVDLTTKLKMLPGLVVIFPVSEGVDTRWKKLGTYDFITEVNFADQRGYSYKWRMTHPALASGVRAVEAQDVRAARKVSLFYPQQETCSMIGFTNILRLSDDLFQALKGGQISHFELDGPDTPLKYNREIFPLPHEIQATGLESVDIFVNNKLVSVRALRAETDNGWRYWVLDNAEFPVLVRGEGPFLWENVQFRHPYFDKFLNGGDTDPEAEARRIISQLEDKGEATTRAILFDFDRHNIKSVSRPILDGLARYMKGKPEVRLRVEGHTDSIGGMEYNMKLSMRRANSVKQYLVKERKIAADRLVPSGFGFTRPVADNSTAEGRQLNRRVVFKRIEE